MKFLKPYKNFNIANITQMFGQYHKAIDSLPFRKEGLGGYGTPLVAPEKCVVKTIYGNKYTPDDFAPLKNGFGLWMKGESGYEHLYWHTQPTLPVDIGQTVEKGQIVAFVGNSGNVFSGGEYVPLEERNVPNFKGTHLHHAIVLNGVPYDPLSLIDLYTEPNYGVLDELIAISKTLLKISNFL